MLINSMLISPMLVCPMLVRVPWNLRKGLSNEQQEESAPARDQ
jgi:hypothetical protein